TSAHDATDVAVSKAKIVATLDRDPAMGLVDVLQGDGGAHRFEPAARMLRPLHERNRAIEVRLQVAPLPRARLRQPVQVEMGARHAGLVAMADRVSRARDRLVDSERAAGAANERRLAGAERSRDRDHVPGPKALREPRAERLRLLRRTGDDP